LAPDASLRSLDAIHLASAELVGRDLRAVVTYDRRMAAVAEGLALPVVTPV
jgi:predicted nucleic acid-binding protein